MSTVREKVVLLIFSVYCVCQSCTGNSHAVSATLQASELTPTKTVVLAPTKISAKTSLIAPTPTIALTPVPPGIFPLLFYPPLIMKYDTNDWVDKSRYADPNFMVNYIQAREFVTCTIGVLGPSGFFPSPAEIVQLGKVKYQVTTDENLLPGETISYYIEDKSLSGYDYEQGLPVLTIEASPSEWSECRIIAEKVLSTLHTPSD